MTDQLTGLQNLAEIPLDVKDFLIKTCSVPSGSGRRKFMAGTVKLPGKGGRRKAEREPGRDGKTIQKGTKEPESGFGCIDNFSGRGRKRAEEHLPDLLKDIKETAEPESQADPAFRTTRPHIPLTAEEVRNRLIQDKNYKDSELPEVRTVQTKLNELNYHRGKVKKSKPQKKLKRQMPYLKMSVK